MSPLTIALVSFGAFLLIGLMAKVAIAIWIKRTGVAHRGREPD